MISHEEKIRKIKKKKKIFIVIALIIVGALIVTTLVMLILNAIQYELERRRHEESMRIAEELRGTLLFPDPDWYFNIFEDEYYMALDRSIWVQDGIMGTVINEETWENFDEYIQFMHDVVQLMIHGDHYTYGDLFMDEYWDNPRNRAHWWELGFTMQRLWNIELQVIDETPETIDIRLTYRIHRNDGTLRNDIPSSRVSGEQGTLPMLYRLVRDDEGNIRILTKFVHVFGAHDDF